MIKKLFLVILILLISIGTTACGTAPDIQSANPETAVSEGEGEETSGIQSSGESAAQGAESRITAPPADDASRILVAYFSCTGSTKAVAQALADMTGADIYEIIPAVPYTPDDLNYSDSSSRATREQNETSARPEIAASDLALADYDTVLIGYPIWWGQAPRIINTFLENHTFDGKTIAPFCTSGSSGIGDSAADLYALCPDTVTWLEGRRFASETEQEEMARWLALIGIIPATAVRSVEAAATFDLDAKTVRLNSGYDMPILGLGTYSLQDEVCVNSVSAALHNGGRLIDTASIYNNEESVGTAIQQSGIDREEIFVTTKLYMNQYADAETAIDEALQKLDLDYIDLLLLHHPGDYDVEAYQEMERAVAQGKVRSIGLSNWYIEELQAFLPQVSIMPALVQNEIHPYYQENDVIAYIQRLGIVVQGWYPLGGRGHTAELLGDPVISDMAQSHEKSPAQVILRWNLQKDVAVIPGSSNADHIIENMDLFGFELTDAEMSRIHALDRNEKHDWY